MSEVENSAAEPSARSCAAQRYIAREVHKIIDVAEATRHERFTSQHLWRITQTRRSGSGPRSTRHTCTKYFTTPDITPSHSASSAAVSLPESVTSGAA